jgi:hypothetical protein
MINLINIDDKVGFEINTEAAKHAFTGNQFQAPEAWEDHQGEELTRLSNDVLSEVSFRFHNKHIRPASPDPKLIDSLYRLK